MPILELEDVHSYYGHIHALKGISLTVEEGEIVTLIGANGAGKSTTLRTISGLIRPRAGTIRFQGQRIDGLPPHRVAALRIGHSPEGRRVFPRMTVRENLEMGAYLQTDKAQIDRGLERVYDLFPRLKEREKQAAGTLSGGEQQMLAIGRVLLRAPRLLLLDEPSDGLAPAVVDQIAGVLERLCAEGISAVLVEQDLHLAFRLADKVAVMRKGRIVHRGPTAEFRSDRRRAHALLGVA